MFVDVCVCTSAVMPACYTYVHMHCMYVRIDGQVHEGESWADGLMGGVSEDRTSAHDKVRVHMRP